MNKYIVYLTNGNVFKVLATKIIPDTAGYIYFYQYETIVAEFDVRYVCGWCIGGAYEEL